MQNNIEIDSYFMSLKEIKEQFSIKLPNFKIGFFEKQYGAHVQVYKKRVKMRIQITSTDDWSLPQQA
jgi:hypothetical protein